MKEFLYPHFRLRDLPLMLGMATVGALLAGCYGAVHDQITYALSEEYFTRVKFQQFHWADFGLPRRVYVSEIGFLATWWAGFFAAWLMARITVPHLPRRQAIALSLQGSAILAVSAVGAGVAGGVLGAWRRGTFEHTDWRIVARIYRVEELDPFVLVAYIHNAGYLGALLGLVVGLYYVRRKRIAWLAASAEQEPLEPGENATAPSIAAEHRAG